MKTHEAVLRLIEQGFAPVPIPLRKKGPVIKEWQKLRITADTAHQFFDGQPQNIGVLLGDPSNGLVDVDLDAPEAVALADHFLPPTDAVFGRAGKLRSHRLYRVPGLKTQKFQAPDNGMIVEVRSTGCQTVVPPSTHPSGEQITWHSEGEPRTVSGEDLIRGVRRLAAAALLVRHFPSKGTRDETAMAIAGTLLKAGWSDEEAEHFIEVVATDAGCEDVPAKVKKVATTRAKWDAGAGVTGLPTLKELLGDTVAGAVSEFLHTKTIAELPAGFEEPVAAPWPTPDPGMFYGIAGEFVRTVEPHTEADPVALLLQFLIAFGNALGRHASFVVEGAHHYLNLFGVLVGQTSKGRKGTSWQYVANLMRIADQVWYEERISSGLASGEGLIWAVRDPIYGTAPRKDTGGRKIQGEFERSLVDAGVDDKRLLVQEPEFASTLRVMKRDGSTLSPIVRKAWDEGKLTSLTKNSPGRATDAHISIIGHITGDELRRELDRTEIANGFVNRFLLICVRRSKILPDGGAVDTGELMRLGQRVEKLLQQFDFSESYAELTRDEAARTLWHEVYEGLSAGKPGLFGAVTSRSEAQVTRLACVYAVLDSARVIRVEHLEAALALWRYVEDSARFLFKESLGDPDADTILAALRSAPGGLTRTGINDLFGRNRPTERVTMALRLLEEQGLATLYREQTGGRPRERWASRVRNV